MSEAFYPVILATVLILFLSGLVKGAIGFGLPLVAVPFLTMLHSVDRTLAIMSLPVVASSVQLSFSGGRFVQLGRKYLWMLGLLAVGVFMGVTLLEAVPAKVVYFVLGSTIILFTFVGKLNALSSIVARHSAAADSIVGLLQGFLGGLSSAFGPLTASYFSAIKLPKDEFVTALNIMLMSGAVFMALALGY